MRWDSLFDDLESQLEREISAEESDVGAEEERLRLGRLTLRDRLVALQDASGHAPKREIGIILSQGDRLMVHPVMIGRDWFSADVLDASSRRRQCVIPIHSIAGISLSISAVSASLAGATEAAHPELSARLGFAFVLRDLCRRRRALEVISTTGILQGTIDRVGKDHVDLAIHERGTPRRASAVSELRVIPLSAIVMVRL